jgi:hypothetical protein
MWLALFVIVGAIFVAIAGVLSGGIFTIILVPLAVIALFAWAGYSALGYLNTSASPQTEDETGAAPLPHSRHSNTAAPPATPDELVDARQHQ